MSAQDLVLEEWQVAPLGLDLLQDLLVGPRLAPHVMAQAGQQWHWWEALLGLACLLPLMGHNLHLGRYPCCMGICL